MATPTLEVITMSDEIDVFKPDPADGIAPDQWAGVRLSLRSSERNALERLTAEFLARGGRIADLPPAPNDVVRQHSYYWPALPEVEAVYDHTTWRALPTDTPWVRQLDKLLNQEYGSRRAMAAELGVSDGVMQRLLAVHFKTDPRAVPFQRLGRSTVKQRETEALWESRKLLVELILEQGIVGYEKVAKASGLSVNMLYTLVDKFDLPIQKFRR